MDVTNNLVKWVYSLSLKKNRDKEKCFVAEGTKCVLDTLGSFRLKYLFCTEEWLESHGDVAGYATVASKVQMERMSMLKTSAEVIAVYEMPEYCMESIDAERNLYLALDNVQDPGNLGTIIRIADWFGIHDIFCSPGTVDVYNPKVVQSTMGAISRVRVHYCSLPELFGRCGGVPVYGTFLDGDNIYGKPLSGNGFIVMGNEGKGISKELEEYVTARLLVPSYPQEAVTSESLNVGMATAIVVSEFRRRML